MSENEEIPKFPSEGEKKSFEGTSDFIEDSFLKEPFAEPALDAPKALLQGVKDKLRSQESVDALIVERESLVQDLENALKYFEVEFQLVSREKVKESADFRGDWGTLTRTRLEHPIGFVKYMLLKLRHIEKLKIGSPNFLEKPTDFRQYVFDQIQHYDSVVENAFSATNVVSSEEKGKLGGSLGVGKYGEQPTVFSNASHKDGDPLTEHQKHIVESHEVGHCIREFIGDEGMELRNLLDMERVSPRERNYLSNPDEIAERMSQLKNYFGIGPTEQFTLEHLQYAREHYVSDTGLDNSMSQFFAGVSSKSEMDFIRLINELPI